ncbi:hypothetical protein OQY15_03835 [Pedobacter sp. MC2016-15]|uniref:hypothetical protein n=1 Tax=Pedobacter sp. MC2016-15 TaxID=2994473 RepID=UPI0022472A51|nr:hypothetical protein [Pedobacter sp. MC2016-15]MCX2478204.1 hypothetical protein [Pedobacter sp. MC2016-15]
MQKKLPFPDFSVDMGFTDHIYFFSSQLYLVGNIVYKHIEHLFKFNDKNQLVSSREIFAEKPA